MSRYPSYSHTYIYEKKAEIEEQWRCKIKRVELPVNQEKHNEHTCCETGKK